LPLLVSCNTPTARGPLTFLVFFGSGGLSSGTLFPGRFSVGLSPCAALRETPAPQIIRMTMTADPNLRYKNFRDITGPGLGAANAEFVDGIFNPDSLEMRLS
jgi:hypothetical protein